MKRLIAVSILLYATAAHAQDAETRVYGAAQSCTGLRAYLRNYPNGRFIADAKARVARECPAETPVQTPRPTVATTPPSSACADARADWANISGTRDMAVLRAFRDSVPAACAVQRAQAQSRIEALEAEKVQADAAAEARTRAWRGAQVFEGSWTKVTGGWCDSPKVFDVRGDRIMMKASSYDVEVNIVSLSPPTLRWASASGTYDFVYTNNEIRQTRGDPNRNCTLRRTP